MLGRDGERGAQGGARLRGIQARVSASKPGWPGWPGWPADSASPGYVPGPERAAARAAASARRALARKASSSSRFVDASAVWPSRTTRISTVVSSTSVACVGIERAKRDISERSRTTVT